MIERARERSMQTKESDKVKQQYLKEKYGKSKPQSSGFFGVGFGGPRLSGRRKKGKGIRVMNVREPLLASKGKKGF